MLNMPAQIARRISDNQKLIHEYELQLAGYEGRTCTNPSKTRDAIVRLKNNMKDLRLELEAAKERERKFARSK